MQNTFLSEAFFSKASLLAVSCALDDERQVHDYSFNELQTILRFVVMWD